MWSHSGITLFVVLKSSLNVLKAEHVEMLKKLNFAHTFIRLLPHDRLGPWLESGDKGLTVTA